MATQKKYYSIYTEIKKKILAGEYPSGEKLPSKRVMADMRGVSLITVERAYAMLEEEGYIRRESDPDDMRAMRVYFTEKGRQLDREFFAHALETDAIIMKGITAEESATLEKLLTRMRENILNELNPKGEEIIK